MPEPEEENAPDPEIQAMEEKWLKFWNEEGVFRFDPGSRAPIFSIDTPPPTVSGRMHIGHAYSYNQMDFLGRYKRLRGFNLFYPFGFDDNGLPTERYTERETGVKITDVGRKEFIRLCLEKTKEAEDAMERSWRRIGTSCDWGLVYQTISPHAIKTSQASFVELYEKGRAYRAERPSIWCPDCRTAIAQVEVEDKNLPSAFSDVAFDLLAPASPGALVHRRLEPGPEANSKPREVLTYTQGAEGKIVISTTRPELIPACVAIFVHPDDERTAHLRGKRVKVPVTGQEVAVLESEKVDKETGTGVVMCCTFGDQTDIEWWQGNRLPLRIAIGPNGRMTDVASRYEGKTIDEARVAIKADLAAEGRLLHEKHIEHAVGVHERCGTPVEFLITKQWFVRYLDLKEEFLRMGAEVRWHPEYMKVRYDNWVKGLKWDWCISRQRYFGVPFPVWYCEGCGAERVAKRADLPVDPVDVLPKAGCEACGGTAWRPESDVMDTWATSSLTPQIALNWVEGNPLFDRAFPMSLRPQAHEIISFWAFNTIVKARFHHGKIPWEDIMISGFVKLGKGKKMSKSKGNIIEPLQVISEYSGDALRYWSATGANLGEDIIYNPKELTRGLRLATKLKNVAGFIGKALGGEKPQRPPDSGLALADRWILTEYSRLVERVTAAWDGYDYTRGIKETENFVWHVLADHYLELVKHRLYGATPDPAAKWTLHTVGLGVIQLLAPVLCFVTEDLYQSHFRAHEGVKSVHVTAWPRPVLDDETAAFEGAVLKDAIAAVRAWKSENKLALNAELPPIEAIATGQAREALERGKGDILGTTKAVDVHFVDAREIQLVPVSVEPNLAKIGPKYKALAKDIVAAVKAMDPHKAGPDGLPVRLPHGEVIRLAAEDYSLKTRPTLHGKEVDEVTAGPVTLLLRKA